MSAWLHGLAAVEVAAASDAIAGDRALVSQLHIDVAQVQSMYHRHTAATVR